MLDAIHIQGFKCFEVLDLTLAPLTLLSGTNGGGKSSVIQALALLAQTLAEREWGRDLLLDGPELSLGSAADVLNHRSAGKRLMLGASAGGERIDWTFVAEDRRSLSLSLDGVQIGGEAVALGDPIHFLLPEGRSAHSPVVSSLRNLSWVTAERMGPRELLPLHDAQGHAHVGARGELTAGLLYWLGEDLEVSSSLCKPGIPRFLYHQVRAYMQDFFPGCDLRVAAIDGASYVSLRLRSNPRSDFQRPQNVGFGLTQVLPIVVAVLASSKDKVLLVENPEVHLHPRAQQEIGFLLARAASSGVQVILETHSDHVLNGARLAVRSKAIGAEQVALHFFSPSAVDGTNVPVSPKIDSDGRLDSWPDGFFDQFDQALSQLL